LNNWSDKFLTIKQTGNGFISSKFEVMLCLKDNEALLKNSEALHYRPDFRIDLWNRVLDNQPQVNATTS
jgi:hypothetical protein